MCTGEADYFRDYKRLGAIAKLATSYKDDPTQLAYGCRCDVGSEALAKCYNVHWGFFAGRELRSWWTTTLLQRYDRSPVTLAHFGEGIDPYDLIIAAELLMGGVAQN